jgi:hypothetical protein
MDSRNGNAAQSRRTCRRRQLEPGHRQLHGPRQQRFRPVGEPAGEQGPLMGQEGRLAVAMLRRFRCAMPRARPRLLEDVVRGPLPSQGELGPAQAGPRPTTCHKTWSHPSPAIDGPHSIPYLQPERRLASRRRLNHNAPQKHKMGKVENYGSERAKQPESKRAI